MFLNFFGFGPWTILKLCLSTKSATSAKLKSCFIIKQNKNRQNNKYCINRAQFTPLTVLYFKHAKILNLNEA